MAAAALRGEALRVQSFSLEAGTVFLNHGSFGALPKEVAARQRELSEEMEAHPDRWFRRSYNQHWEEATGCVAKLVGAEAKDLVFVKNATAGVNAVLNTLRLEAGDACLVTTQTYAACANAVKHVCERSGASVVVLDLDRATVCDDERHLQALRATLAGNQRIRFALLDHITSPTAVIFPVQRLCAVCHEFGVQVMVDGAHAPGTMALDIPSIGADWYTANLHKWMFCPKGCAFLWVPLRLQSGGQAAQSILISHSWQGSFQDRFKTQGTQDDSAFFAAPRAFQFVEEMGGLGEVAAHNHALAAWAGEMLARRWGTELYAPTDKCSSMVTIRCPFSRRSPDEDLFALVMNLGIVVPVIQVPGADGDWVRISAQLYNRKEDYEKLATAILMLASKRLRSPLPPPSTPPTKPALRLVVIRHGESTNNVLQALGREIYEANRLPDPSLSEVGIRQAQLLADHIKHPAQTLALLGSTPISALWVSPHLRALQTMQPIAVALTLAPHVDVQFFEAGGIYSSSGGAALGGLARSEMLAQFPMYSIPPTVTDSGWYNASGKESNTACRLRVARLAVRLKAEARALGSRSTVLVVTHHDTICALLEALVVPERDFGDGRFVAFKTANTSITVVDIDGASGEVSLTLLGSVPHLASHCDLVPAASV